MCQVRPQQPAAGDKAADAEKPDADAEEAADTEAADTEAPAAGEDGKAAEAGTAPEAEANVRNAL